MSTIQPMDYVDACFFAVDAGDMPQVIAALCLLDREPDAQSIIARIEQILTCFPRLRQRVVRKPQLGWEDDPNFRPSDHVNVMRTTHMRERGDLEEEVGKLIRQLPDMSRPPWQIVILTNGVDCHGLLLCVHHGLADGVRMIRLLDALSSSARDASAAPIAPERIEAPLRRSALQKLRSAAGCSWKLLKESVRPSHASALNGRTSGERHVALADFSRADVIRVMQHFGGSLHDVLFAIVAGAVRRFHEARGLPTRDLRMIVPMSVPPVVEKGGLGNHLVISSLRLPISTADPARRLAAVRELFARMKSDGTIAAYAFFGYALARLVPRRFHQTIWRPVLRATNLVCTILLGPENARYVGGARINRVYGFPAPIIQQGAAFSFASYAGQICAACVCDGNVVTDPAELTKHLRDSFQELRSLAVGHEAGSVQLLGHRQDNPDGRITFDGMLDITSLTSKTACRLGGHAVLSSAVLLELAWGAGTEVFRRSRSLVHDVSFERPLWLAGEGIHHLQTTLFWEDPACYSFQIASLAPGRANDWARHVCGGISEAEHADDVVACDLDHWRHACDAPLGGDAYYRQLDQCGVQYNQCLQSVQRLWRGDSQVLAEIELPTTGHDSTEPRTSALIESCVQVALAASPLLGNYEPLAVERVTSLRICEQVSSPRWIHAKLRDEQTPWAVDVVVANTEGVAVAVIEDLRFRGLDDCHVPSDDEVDVRQLLREADDSKRRDLVESQARLQLGRVLGSGAARHMSLDDRLVDLGIDSMMAVELKLRLEAAFEEKLPDNLVLEQPTLRALRESLWERFR